MSDTRHLADIFSEARQRGWKLTGMAVDNRITDGLPPLNGSEEKTLESILILAARRLPEASDEDLLRLAGIAWNHVSGVLVPGGITAEVPAARISVYPRPEHTHGEDAFPPTNSLRSGTLAEHMTRFHTAVMRDQLAANGYSIGTVSHTWLSDVHTAHHAGDL